MGKQMTIDWGTETGQAVLRILRILREKGGRGVLVGGCVRDAMLGLEGKDFDIEVYGIGICGFISRFNTRNSRRSHSLSGGRSEGSPQDIRGRSAGILLQ